MTLMGRTIALEICIDSLDSAYKIQKVSEHFSNRVPWRIELCSNLITGGGLTPSVGLLRACRKLLPDTEIMVMIRPRTGSFTYADHEIAVMEEDIRALGEAGATGFVFGCLTPDGDIDMTSMNRLLSHSQRKPVTFHRAFDLTSDAITAYRDLCQLPGLTRVLTSGHGRNVNDGLTELQSLSGRLTESNDETRKVAVLPGSGVNGAMLREFLSNLPEIEEVHLSASEAVDEPSGPLRARGVELGFGNGQTWTMSEEKLHSAFHALVDL